MKTKEEIFGPGLPTIAHNDRVYTMPYAHRKADEYAEEHAKAFGEFCFNTHVPGESDIDDVYKMFKESLKK